LFVAVLGFNYRFLNNCLLDLHLGKPHYPQQNNWLRL
jgi:hypothetical protein